jgi:hypothetical protein
MQIKDMFEELADKITPSMKLLTQATSPCDETLHSLLGRKVDKVYERLYDAASNSRLNREPSLSVISEYVKPLSQRLSAKM